MARDTFENKDEMDQPVQADRLGTALIYVTTIVLAVSFILMEQALAKKFNAGMFADAAAGAPGTPVAPKK
jgi:hypothetical protein